MLSIVELTGLVSRADPGNDHRFRESRERTLSLLGQGPLAIARTNYRPGHITGSAIVLTPLRTHVLLVHHRHLGRWLQPGGHIEPEDGTVVDTAVREVAEETGIEVQRPDPPLLVGIDVHDIPGGAREPPHLHYDLVWRLFGAGPLNGTEEAIWCPVADLHARGPDAALAAAVERALRIP